VKLLLDEHFSPRIAEILRAKGHDVSAVAQSGLVGLSDRQLASVARDDGRVLVTENVGDFQAIAGELAHVGAHHVGLIFTNPRRFPRSRSGIGRLVDALDVLLVAHPEDDGLIDRAVWLDAAEPRD
jgi:hypothetical protein